MLELIRMMEGQPNIGLFVIRQSPHTLLKRTDDCAYFNGHGVGYASVQIRGGMVLEIPLDKHGPVRAGVRMGGHPDFIRQSASDEVPVLEPDEAMTRLIAAE